MIQHKGKIVYLDNNNAEIIIEQTSACASCHAKNICMPNDKKEQKIVAKVSSKSFSIGEEVNLILNTKQGYKAVLFAYIIPVLIAVVSLAISNAGKLEDWKSAIFALIMVTLYFIILKLLSIKITRTIEFKVEKINNI